MKALSFFAIGILLLGAGLDAAAQDYPVQVADTLLVDDVRPAADSLAAEVAPSVAAVDSTLLGRSIFDDVTVDQTPQVREAVENFIASSEIAQTIAGFRIRIFFSNAQDAREASETAATVFAERFPGYEVYRNYVYPNFKVTVGDFRSRSEAMVLLNAVRGLFPAAFIVREEVRCAY